MKRKSRFTFFELKVTFYFDLFRFFIGGIYDEKDKSVHLSLIPFLVLKIENGRAFIRGKVENFNTNDVKKDSVDFVVSDIVKKKKKIKK